MTEKEFRAWLEEQAEKEENPDVRAYIRGILAAGDMPTIPLPEGAPIEAITPPDLGDEDTQLEILAAIDEERRRRRGGET